MKKVISLFLVLILFSSLGLNISHADSPSNWAKLEIEKLKKTGYFEEGRFSDFQKPITRGEFIYFAARLFEVMSGEEIEISKDIAFSDTADYWVLKGASVGITDGLSDGSFGPYQLLTREQLATMLIRTLKLGNVPLDTPDDYMFSDDSEISSWAKEPVYLARANGIIDGMGDGRMAPKDNATIEQCMVIINRILKNNAGKEFTYNGKSNTIFYEYNLSITNDFIKLEDDKLYYGEIKNGLADGYGVITDSSGNFTYIGEMKENKKDGLGILFDIHGMYVGSFENDYLNGFGLLASYNKEYAVVNFHNNQLNGYVLHIDSDGKAGGSYWKNNEFIGNVGHFELEMENIKAVQFPDGLYRGEVKDGLPNGKGVFNSNSGEIYIGEFVDGQFHGDGTLIINYSEIYIGLFQNGKFTGNGWAYESVPDGYKYISEIENYDYRGNGIYIYTNGTIAFRSYANNDIHDKWIYADSNGQIDIGTFQGRYKVGKGITLYTNGGIYIGEYSESQMDGQGVYRTPDGILSEGLWNNNKFKGQ